MRPSLRSALETQCPLVTPLAHDALSARLIQMAGFKGFTIGGSAMLAARYALPDLGLIGLSDMTAGIREIAEATELPFLADGDDGYGDAKSVVRMIAAYERLGVGGLLIEDQDRDVKQQRADRALRVVDESVIAAKLVTALSCRSNPETLIIARTDAYGVLGLDAALKRAERMLSLGVDGVFVAGLREEDDFLRVGRALRGPFLSAAMFEGGDTPWLTPAALGEMGFTQVSFPSSLILRVVDALSSGLQALRQHLESGTPMVPLAAAGDARRRLDAALQVQDWLKAGVPGDDKNKKDGGVSA